ncbi:MAG: DUF4870 domain-containing protein [Xanthomonadaceae bacterium]|nr:DUF4870 domain-containing protein [Xanthomonadaceae bacterium]
MTDETSQDGQISQDDKTMAMLSHLLGIVIGFIGCLIIWLINKDKPEKAFVIDQAKEALNFQITIFIASFISVLLVAVFIGLLLAPAVFIINIVFCIIAGMAANKGVEYRYPFALRLIK